VVLSTACQQVSAALVDLWHCDGEGRYDNAGFRCRGHELAAADGRLAFETVRPGRYPGRTRHFHVKLQAPGGPLLTTQLYFPDQPANSQDSLFRPDLLLRLARGQDGAIGSFTFVLALA